MQNYKIKVVNPTIVPLDEQCVLDFNILDFTSGITLLQLVEYLEEIGEVKLLLFVVENDNEIYNYRDKLVDVYLDERVSIKGKLFYFNEGILVLERT